jgi:hypothetical protein
MKQLIYLNKTGPSAICILTAVFFALLYLIGTSVWAETNQTNKETANNAAVNQTVDIIAPDKTAIAPYGAEFTKVTARCLKCHTRQFSSTDNLIKIKWIVPGKPEVSPIYKVIGKNKKPKGTYHNLTNAEKLTVSAYIKNLK